MFFYFFESRRDPDKGKRANFTLRSQFLTCCVVDDVMMWINGGATISFRDSHIVSLTPGQVLDARVQWDSSWNLGRAASIWITSLRMEPPGIRTAGTMRPIFFSWTNRMSHDLRPCCVAAADAKSSCRVGVGFSYADYGEVVETTEDAAKNVHAFITIFFETFTQFSGRPFHLSGESYAVGRSSPDKFPVANFRLLGAIPSRLRQRGC